MFSLKDICSYKGSLLHSTEGTVEVYKTDTEVNWHFLCLCLWFRVWSLLTNSSRPLCQRRMGNGSPSWPSRTRWRRLFRVIASESAQAIPTVLSLWMNFGTSGTRWGIDGVGFLKPGLREYVKCLRSVSLHCYLRAPTPSPSCLNRPSHLTCKSVIMLLLAFCYSFCAL